MLIQQGNNALEQAKKSTEQSQTESLRQKARVAFQDAEKLFTDGVKELADELNKILGAKIDAADGEAIERREAMKGDYRKSQIMIGWLAS